MVNNCWEIKKCGREKGGSRALELGICPASSESRVDGIHHGKNGGRCCWALEGTLCDAQIQGSFASKLGRCMECDFYVLVHREEGRDILRTNDILAKLR